MRPGEAAGLMVLGFAIVLTILLGFLAGWALGALI